jgi:ABC-type nitrate/sulfonate/bicarbonate transport system substrate-binding protein
MPMKARLLALLLLAACSREPYGVAALAARKADVIVSWTPWYRSAVCDPEVCRFRFERTSCRLAEYGECLVETWGDWVELRDSEALR